MPRTSAKTLGPRGGRGGAVSVSTLTTDRTSSLRNRLEGTGSEGREVDVWNSGERRTGATESSDESEESSDADLSQGSDSSGERSF